MSQENVEIVQSAFDAFNRGALDAVSAVHDPAIEWRTSSEDPDPATHRGPDGVRRYFEQWIDSFAGLRAELEECFEVTEDRVFTTVHYIGRGSASGVDMNWRQSLVFTLRGRLIVRVEEYFDRGEAINAVGLSE
jgi:ketosteroid isomerase-like protein